MRSRHADHQLAQVRNAILQIQSLEGEADLLGPWDVLCF